MSGGAIEVDHARESLPDLLQRLSPGLLVGTDRMRALDVYIYRPFKGLLVPYIYHYIQ